MVSSVPPARPARRRRRGRQGRQGRQFFSSDLGIIISHLAGLVLAASSSLQHRHRPSLRLDSFLTRNPPKRNEFKGFLRFS